MIAGKALPCRTPLDGPLSLFLLGAVVGLVVVYDRALSWPTLTALVGGTILYYCLAWFASSDRAARMSATVLMLTAAGVAVYFVIQYGHLAYPVKSRWVHGIGLTLAQVMPRLAAWQPHPNSVATFLEGSLPPGLVLTATAARPLWRGLVGLATLAVLAGLLMSISRGAWIALALTFTLGFALRWRRWGLLLGCVSLAVALWTVGYLFLVEGASLESFPILGPLAIKLFVRPDRLAVWQGSIYLIQDFPFTGIGLGHAFPLVYGRYALLIPVPFLLYSHNLWLEVWLQQGLLGIVGFVWLIAAFYAFVVRTIREKATASAAFHGAWLGVTAILLHGFFDAAQYAEPWVFLSLFALLGLAVATGSRDRQQVGNQRQSRVAVAGLLAIGLVALVGLAFWQPLASRVYVNRGALRQAQGDLVEELPEAERARLLAAARTDYERGLSLDPQSRPAHQRLGVLDINVGRYEEAVAHLEAAWQIDPHNTTTHKALGLAYVWMNRLDEAKPLLTNVPGIVEELNLWGGWRSRQGEKTLARNAYQMSLRLDPDQKDIQRALARLQGE